MSDIVAEITAGVVGVTIGLLILFALNAWL